MSAVMLILLMVLAVFQFALKESIFEQKRKDRTNYYRNVYLKSEAWRKKRYVVLKRDNWTCKYCGGKATQVHHIKYAKKNIGKEPIDWLVSVCKSCHERKHSKIQN